MIRLKIHQLESFLQVAESGSFRKAAEMLHRSPSAVSAHVLQLEDQLEVSLLDRTTRSTVLTPEGRLLFKRCEQLLTGLNAAAQEVHDEAVLRKSRISVGVSPSVARHHLLPIISRHRHEHPGVALELHESFAEGLYQQLSERNTDFAIGPGIAGRKDFHVRPIIKDPIVAVLPPDFVVAARGVMLSQIAAQNQICMPRGTAIRQVVEKAFETHGLAFHSSFEVMYPQGLLDLVGAGMGVGLMPLLSMPPPPHTHFKLAPLADGTMYREMCLITLKARKQSPLARRLAERIVAALRESVSETPAVWPD